LKISIKEVKKEDYPFTFEIPFSDNLTGILHMRLTQGEGNVVFIATPYELEERPESLETVRSSEYMLLCDVEPDFIEENKTHMRMWFNENPDTDSYVLKEFVEDYKKIGWEEVTEG